MNAYLIEDEIKALRKKLGLSQEKFAELIGVHKHTVQNWEYHKVCPTKANVQSLISTLNLTRKEYPELFDFAKGVFKPQTEEVLIPDSSSADNEENVSGGRLNRASNKINPVVKSALIGAAVWVILLGVSFIAYKNLSDAPEFYWSGRILDTDPQIRLIFTVSYVIALLAVVEAIALGIYFLHKHIAKKRRSPDENKYIL